MLPYRTAFLLLFPLLAMSGRLARADDPAPVESQTAQATPSISPLLPVEVVADAPAGSESPGAALSAPAAQPEESSVSSSLTLDDLEALAWQSNPTLLQATLKVQEAQGDYVQAGLYPNPVIGYAGADVGLDNTSGQQGAFIVQEFVTAHKLRLGRAVAGHEIQQARHASETQVRRVLNDVRAGYYEVLLAQKMVEVNEQLVRISKEGLKVTKQLRAAMEVSQADVLQAQIEADTAALGLYEAQNNHQAAWQRLTSVLGQPDMSTQSLTGVVDKNLPRFDRESTLAQILAQSPELSVARSGIERARCDLALQKAERIPNFEVGTGVKYDESAHTTLADVEVGIPLPVFNWNQGNIRKARAQLTAAHQELRRVELDLYHRFAAAYTGYANARRQVETYSSTILPHAQESLELNRAGYREGEFSYLTLLTAQRTYFSVNLSYLAYLQELWTTSVELEGMLLSGGLDAVE